MARISRTWWGERFLEALEQCTDSGRLSRGRSYSRPGRMLSFSIEGAHINARLRGNINPYFGVYKEPRYTVEIQLKAIAAKKWKQILKRLAGNAGWLSRLLMNEMPDDIEDAFRDFGVSLLPASPADLKTACSCPDWANPCKHVAGTYYKVAGLLDQDPFLLFELRGITRKKLRKQLASTPLGKALVAEMEEGLDAKPEPVASRFPAPARMALEGEIGLRDFWQGKSIPELPPTAKGPGVPALLIKKQGDYPPFWPGDNSFIEAMEAIYEQVRIKNKKSL